MDASERARLAAEEKEASMTEQVKKMIDATEKREGVIRHQLQERDEHIQVMKSSHAEEVKDLSSLLEASKARASELETDQKESRAIIKSLETVLERQKSEICDKNIAMENLQFELIVSPSLCASPLRQSFVFVDNHSFTVTALFIISPPHPLIPSSASLSFRLYKILWVWLKRSKRPFQRLNKRLVRGSKARLSNSRRCRRRYQTFRTDILKV